VNYRENDATTKTEMNGVAIYTGTSVGSADLDLRFDFIDDEGITTGGTDTEVWAVTATASWALSDGVDFRLEYRHDDADDAIFSDDSSGGTDDALDTVQVQLVWNP
ncbi:MAG: outer membrane beta-barrel protein, partial [Deltaproteobacteria bacterium]